MLYINSMQARSSGLRGGIHEVVIGVPDIDTAVSHWQAFGYDIVQRGQLSDSAALELYGYRESLQAVRLGHGKATSGLVRLQQWNRPLAAGLASAPLRVTGSRWSVHRTHDITPALVWGRYLEKSAPGTVVNGPVIQSVSAMAASINHAVLTPLYRHVLMVRHGIDVPVYGTPDPGCLLGSSEVVHAGIVVNTVDAALLEFYSLLGFKPMSVRRVVYDRQSVATQLFPLYPGEALVEHDFDDPESTAGRGQLPGRLRAFVLEPGADSPQQTVPGDLGYGLYTVRHTVCNGPEMGRKWLQDLGATSLGCGPDEFGVRSCRFRAPDGYQWLGMAAEKPD